MNANIEDKAQYFDPRKSKTIGNYVIGSTLGVGNFGKSRSAIHIPTGEKVAIKIFQKQRLIRIEGVQSLALQIQIIKLLRHSGIIQLYQIIQTPKQVFLVMEYMQSGELFDYIVNCRTIPEEEACVIFQQIIGAIEYIHKLNIAHRNLKPQNFLLDYDKSIRLIDFGLCNTYKKGQKLKTACGSPCYAAPEMIEVDGEYQPIMVDIWSSGVILYAMLCGCLPFEDPNTSKLYHKILSGQYKVPKTLSENAKDLLSKILTVDPNKRFRIEDIRKHKWWNLASSPPITQGIIVSYHRIPVEQNILQETVKLGFDQNFTKKCIQANRHNDATTTYNLLLKKFVRGGGVSKTYLGSKYFDPSLIEPIRRIPAQNDLVNRFRQLNTPSNRLGNSLKVREDRTISLEKGANEHINRTLGKDTKANDQISKNYRQTYGVSLVSKSRQKSQNKRNKHQTNRTLVIYKRGGKAKSSSIRVDKGLESTLNTIDKIQKKTQFNQRFIYH